MISTPLTPGEFQRFCGTTLHRMSLWTERGYFGRARRRVGRGNARRYSVEDVVVARILNQLSNFNFRDSRVLEAGRQGLAQMVRRVCRQVRQERKPGEAYRDIAIVVVCGGVDRVCTAGPVAAAFLNRVLRVPSVCIPVTKMLETVERQIQEDK